MKQNDFFDILKFILALSVLAIHSGTEICVFGFDLLWPWVRLAVPLFFVLSSYLFFMRLANATDKQAVVASFVGRILLLYLAWFIILLPTTLVIRYRVWFCSGMVYGCVRFLRDLFLGSTFPASWFLMALVEAMLFVLLIIKIIPSGWWLIGCVAYIWCVLCSSYENLDLVFCGHGIMSSWSKVFGAPYNSFPVAILWVMMGKAFADLKSRFDIKCKSCLLLFCLSAMLFWLEWRWRNSCGFGKADCYFTLVPICALCFRLILTIKVNFSEAKMLRALSVLIFVLHATVIRFIPKRIWSFDKTHLLGFLLTLTIVLMVSTLILRLERRERGKWLKYLH